MSNHHSPHLTEFLFWLHTCLILAAVAAGLILPVWAVLILVFLHRLHVIVFKGCLLSNLQKHFGGLKRQQDCIQFGCYHLFGWRLTVQQSRWLGYAITLCPVLLAVVRERLGS